MNSMMKITLALMALMTVSACSSTESSVYSDYDYEASYDAGSSSGYPVTDLLNYN